MKEIEMGKWVLNVMINLKLNEKRSVLITTKWSYKIKQFQKKKKISKKGKFSHLHFLETKSNPLRLTQRLILCMLWRSWD